MAAMEAEMEAAEMGAAMEAAVVAWVAKVE